MSKNHELMFTVAGTVFVFLLAIGWRRKKRNASSDDTASGDGDLSSKPRPSCTPPAGKDYEVFLSFRGEETRKDFTDHLYNRLYDAGVWVFRDNEGLHVGEEIGPQLMKAINASKISIPIISPDYASSEWCLRELVQILECKNSGQIVLPIFYKVTPSSVRNQTGKFKKAFLSHQKKYDSSDIQKWRKALEEVASMKGLESDKFADGHEGELVKEVLKEVLKKLKKADLVVEDRLIGVQDHIDKIIEKVDPRASAEVQVLLIHGMGGIGKTTLAKLIYNLFYTQYDRRSFLSDVRERSSDNRGRVDLQKQLISDILDQTSAEGIANTDAGINIIKDRFRGKKVLILLDDVSHIDQLKALARESDWFEPGSLLIITSRNKDILKKWDKKLTHELNGLDPEQSFQLFCFHAFRSDNARQSELEHIAREIVSTTGGLPLAIEVIGSLLFAEFKDIWEDTLKRLQEAPDDKVMAILKISYDSLNYKEQQIFLDIACFSFKYEENFAFYMWDACGFHPHLHVQNLISLSLIKIEDNNRFIMHDQLRDLGRLIARQGISGDGEEPSRLWAREEAWEVLNGKQGTKKIEAISLVSGDKSKCCSLTNEHFKDLTKLRLLRLEDASLNGDFDNLLRNLTWLTWRGSYNSPMETMPDNFLPRKLVILELDNIPITEDWKGWSQIEVVKELKMVRLSDCRKLNKTPDFSSFKKLEILIICGCPNLIEIHPSICNIKNTLMTLEVSYCRKLKELPIEVGELEKLKDLTLHQTSIRKIPESIGSLVKLHTLTLWYCHSLTKIPTSIGKLGSLSKLRLYLTGTEVPLGSIGNLHNLEELYICKFQSLETIIDLSELKKLTKLEFCGCGELKYLQGLKSLHGLSHLKKLTWFHLKKWDKLIGVEGIGQLISLEELSIEKCKSLETIDDLSHLQKLEKLDLSNCDKLIGVEGIGQLMSLKELSIENCKSLETIDDLSHLKKLEKLQLSGCDKSICVKGLSQLISLEMLYIKDCPHLGSIGELPHMEKLRELWLERCYGLRNADCTGQLPYLEKLFIKDCPLLEIVLDSLHLKKLQELNLFKCWMLRGVEGIGQSTSLERLIINHCPSLERIDNLSQLKKLQELDLSNCRMLSRIEGISQLTSLEILKFKGLLRLKIIGDLSQLENLSELTLENCEKLSGVKGIGQLTSLEFLLLKGLPCIKTIGDLSQLEKLKQIVLSNREMLSGIKGISDAQVSIHEE